MSGTPTLVLVISKYLQASALFPQAPKCILHTWFFQIAFKIYKEMVFPVAIRNGSGLNPAQIQIIKNEMRQYIVQAAALMGHFKTDADLLRILAENRLIRHNHKPG